MLKLLPIVALLALAFSAPALATDRYVSRSGADSGACISTACSSFDYAYKQSDPGDTVHVDGNGASGPYPFQIINNDSTKTSSIHVTFVADSGETVTVGAATTDDKTAIEVWADHITLKDIDTAYLPAGSISIDYPAGSSNSFPTANDMMQGTMSVQRTAEDVTLENIDAGALFLAGKSINVLGGDFGPTQDEVSKVAESGGSGILPENVTIDGARFHDFRHVDQHMECMHVLAVDGLTIRNSKFENCSAFAIFAKHLGSVHRIEDVTIENNWFRDGGDQVQQAMIEITRPNATDVCDRIVIQNNTLLDQKITIECPGTGNRVTSNIIAYQNFNCANLPTGWTWEYNVWETGLGGAFCPGDYRDTDGVEFVERPVDFNSPDPWDLHLTQESDAIDRGSPTDYAASDMDGQLRPIGAATDAGADEVPTDPLFVASLTGAVNSSSTFAITSPSGAQVGDTLIAWVATDSTHTINSLPSGWTQIGVTQNDATDSSVSAFSHVVGFLDSTSWSGSFGGGESGIVGVLAYRNVDTVASTQGSDPYGLVHSTGSVTPADDRSLVLGLFGGDPNCNPLIGSADSSPAATGRVNEQNQELGYVYAEDFLQTSAAVASLDVTWGTGETSANFALALSPR